jgi:threonine synthase
LNLTSANSINFARLLPQTFYYFHAVARLKDKAGKTTISVPCGNYGNLTAGIIAKKMGLDIYQFVASANANHPVTDYLETGNYKPHSSIQTISTAMDVGDPSNFQRLLKLFNNDHEKISECIKGSWFSDSETREGMWEIYNKYGYISDPHGAVAWLGLKKQFSSGEGRGIFLETAHPVKFQSEVEAATGIKVTTPDALKELFISKGDSVKIKATFDDLKNFLVIS